MTRTKTSRRGPLKKARILMVDDHPVVRQGLALMIGQEPDLVICGECENGGEALGKLESSRPDAVIVDVGLKDMDGIDLVKEIRRRRPKLAVLVLSMYDEELYAERALRAGAAGYIMKEEAPEKVLFALRAILKGQVYAGEKMVGKLLRRIARPSTLKGVSVLDCLSDRELEVFRLIGRGWATRRIAERLGRSVKTVETHREHIKRKLALENGAELARLAAVWAQARQV